MYSLSDTKIKTMKANSGITGMCLLLLITTLAGCNKEDEMVVRPQNELVAVAGEDKTVKVNEEILLDASASYDRNNKPFTYRWSVKTRPQGSVAALTASNSIQTTFTPDAPGVYIIKLMISQGNWSSMDELTITVTSAEPNGPLTVIIADHITTNTTLTDIVDDPSQPDYIVVNDVEVRSDIIIMPGVVVAFEENKSLQIISGSIRAKGTSDNGIILRGLGNTPAYWKGVLIYSNSERNEFQYVTIEQAGSSVFAESGKKASVTLAGTDYSGAALNVSHSAFYKSGGYGVYVQGASTLNHFSNNTFFNNVSVAAYIPANQLHRIATDTFSENHGFEVETGGLVIHETEVAWKPIPNGSYRVTSDIRIRSGVTIEAGAFFKMDSGVTIHVSDNGYLNAAGVEASRITFTSTGSGVRWNGFLFDSPNENNNIIYCEVSDAGLNVIADAAHPANIVVGDFGKLTIQNSVIRNGLGYGLVTKVLENVNHNMVLVNTFENLGRGSVFPTILSYPDRPSVTGVWLDEWSFSQRLNTVADDFYNRQTQTWFDGAPNPWTMSPPGFGIRFDENGNFTWTAAEHSPSTGCESYSAEYMTGSATVSADRISFDQNYWRSKFINSCDETQNVDIEVAPSVISLPYEIFRLYDMFSGEGYWGLKFTNPDGSTFSYYRR